MSKGKTFSVTVPLPLFEKLEKEAKEQGISRSKRVYNIIQQHYTQPQLEPALERCALEQDTGICRYYEIECPIKNALSQRQCEHFEDPEILKHLEEKGK